VSWSFFDNSFLSNLYVGGLAESGCGLSRFGKLKAEIPSFLAILQGELKSIENNYRYGKDNNNKVFEQQ
jgi:hypothetical protein